MKTCTALAPKQPPKTAEPGLAGSRAGEMPDDIMAAGVRRTVAFALRGVEVF